VEESGNLDDNWRNSDPEISNIWIDTPRDWDIEWARWNGIWTLKTIEGILEAEDLFAKIYKELKEEFQEKTGENLDDIIVDTTAPNILSTDEYTQSVQIPMVQVIGIFLDRKIKELPNWSKLRIQDFTTHSKVEKYINDSAKQWNQSTLIQEFKDRLVTIINLALKPYIPTSIYQLEDVIVWFSDFLDREDIFSYRLWDLDEDYLRLTEENTDASCYPNLPNASQNVIISMLDNPHSVLQRFSEKDIERTLKILCLSNILIQFLYQYQHDKEKVKPEHTIALGVLFYLLELIEEDEWERKIKSTQWIYYALWIQASSSQYRKLHASKFYSEYINRDIEPQIRRFLATIAIQNPDKFIDKEIVQFDKTATLLAWINDPVRQSSLMRFMSQIPANSQLDDIDIWIIIFTAIEDLPYVQDLTPDDIVFIQQAFLDQEWEHLEIVRDIKLLYELDYDSFTLIRTVESSHHGWRFITHMLENRENLEHGIAYLVRANSFTEEVCFLPNCYKDILDFVWVVLDLSKRPYERDIEKIETAICDTKALPGYTKLVATNRKIYEWYESSWWTFDEVMNCLDKVYWALPWKDVDERTSLAMIFWSLSFDDLERISGVIWDQNLWFMVWWWVTQENIWAFVVFIDDISGGDDLESSYELFISELDWTEEENKISLQDQLLQILWTDYGKQILSCEYDEVLLWEIIQTAHVLDEAMRQIFAYSLIKYEVKITEEINKNYETFLEKIIIVRRVYRFLDGNAILPIDNPETFFEHTLMWKHTLKTIWYMTSTLEWNIDSSSQHSEARACIMSYVRYGKKSIIIDFFWKSNRDENQDTETQEVTDSKQRKKKKKTETAITKMTLSLSEKTDRDMYTQLSSSIDSPKEFIEKVTAILWSKNTYHVDVYAFIAYVSTVWWIEIDDWLISKLSKKMSWAGLWNISWRWLLQLWQCLQSDTISELEYKKNTVLISTILRVIDEQLTHSKHAFNPEQIAQLISNMSYLEWYDFSHNIIERLIQLLDSSESVYEDWMYNNLLGWLLFYRKSKKVSNFLSRLFKNPPDLEKTWWHTIMSLVQKYCMHWQKLPRDLQERYETEKTKREGNFWSIPEKKLYELILQYYPYAQNGVFIDGFECDIVVGEDDFMIEYDWKKYHSGQRRRKDRYRDEYFGHRNKINGTNSYAVYRINSDMRYLEWHLLDVLKNYKEA